MGRMKVKRDGPRGWHWIAAEHYDPHRHELVDDEPQQEIEDEPQQAVTVKRGRGRPRKNQQVQE